MRGTGSLYEYGSLSLPVGEYTVLEILILLVDWFSVVYAGSRVTVEICA